jgi:hypothetical protein
VLESLNQLGILRHLCRKELHRHAPAQPHVFGFVNYTHPAAANFPRYAVMGDYRPISEPLSVIVRRY